MSTMSLPIPVLTGASSLDAYIQAVGRMPLLSAEEEFDLGERLRLNNDLEAAQQMVLSHLRLVVSITRQYSGYGLSHADLIQEGNIGLMKAVRRFDARRGVRLVSFAVHWIRAEIHEFVIRNWRMVKIATTKAQRKLFFNLRSLKAGHAGLGKLDAEAIAQTLGVKPEEVREMDTRLSGGDVSLEGGQEDDDETFSPIAYLADERDEPSKILETRQWERLEAESLKSALDALDERSRRILEARWLNEGDAKTLHELAAEYGISAERVRQLEQKALKDLKRSLSDSLAQ